MAIKYPNGKKYEPKTLQKAVVKRDYGFGNRGKTLEDEIEETNQFYLLHNKAVIHKKPVPIQVVQVDYPMRSAAVIKEAYYRTPSTTDFNGVYKGKYIDFEAKETQNKTAFPLKNIHLHQVEHLKQVKAQQGIAFFILRFSVTDRYFILAIEQFLPFWDDMHAGGRKSIPLQQLEENGIEMKRSYSPSIDYLSYLDPLIRS